MKIDNKVVDVEREEERGHEDERMVRRKWTKEENKHVEKEEERDHEVEVMVRRWWTKEENKLVMRCFYRSDPTRKAYRKRMIAIWREIGTFEITEQRLVNQARVIRINTNRGCR